MISNCYGSKQLMPEKSVEDLLRETAIQRAVPFLSGETAVRHSNTYSGSGLEILWDEGYLPARATLIAQGVPAADIDLQLAKVKELLDIVEPSDLVAFPADLHGKLITEIASEIASEPPLKRQRLDERVVRAITEFKVEMFSNESKHAGRPHVKVHLKGGAVSISLDDPPESLTPTGGIVGEASAIKVVAKNRKTLLALWNETRPDDQKILKPTRPATTNTGKQGNPKVDKVKKR